jgi:hypothetical protein
VTNNTTRTRTIVSSVLVIGSGGAGLRAAIAAHEAGTDVHPRGIILRMLYGSGLDLRILGGNAIHPAGGSHD